ncbi:hypothetical protein HWV62_3607 [Athelia sp. TMB]|nr:hypothetical protein HWV62_3607 [Athelia sp. TMB]
MSWTRSPTAGVCLGKGTTFYSYIGVPSTATVAEINKAYRKKSMLLHPDKNPNVKGIHERFARLGIIATILRTTEGRKRYDHFYKNGVPRWRGTGYYYSRWRPGMLEVSIFLISLTSLLQYIVQRMTYKADLQRIEKIVSEAKLAAWGPKMIPVQGSRKIKMTIGGNPGVDNEGNRTGGRSIDMVVEGNGNVSIVDDNGEHHPLDAASASPASFGRTWFISVIKNLLARATNRTSNDKTEPIAEVTEDTESSETESSAPESGTTTPIEGGAAKAGRQPAMRAGGKRRGNVRKRA